MRHANVRNADEVEAREMIKGRHNMRLRQLGKPAGSIALGATEVAPGGISFPRHAHHVNEEAIYVLSGSGEDRRCTRSCAAGGLDCVADRPRSRTSDGQRLDRRIARLSLYLDDARGRDCRVSRFRQSRRWRRRSDKPSRLPPHWHVSDRQRHARLLGERARGGLSSVQPGHSPCEGAYKEW